ncbi:hypothetical protein ATKI12_1758 [Kitasatospora sp. Ki12]
MTRSRLAVTVRPRDLPWNRKSGSSPQFGWGLRQSTAPVLRALWSGWTRGHAAAAIDNSTWLRYAGRGSRVKPALRDPLYPQPVDNDLIPLCSLTTVAELVWVCSWKACTSG